MSNYKSINLSDEQLLSHSKGRVYNHKDINLKGSTPTPVMGGLYDRRIFGSERFCNCGRAFSADHVCPVCAVRIDKESELKKNFGHIELNYPYVSPFQLPTFLKKFQDLFASQLNALGENFNRIRNINSFMMKISTLEFGLEDSEDENSRFKSDGANFEITIGYANDDSRFNLIGLHGLRMVLDSLDQTEEIKSLNSMIHKILLVSPAIVRRYSITNVSGKPLLHIPQATIDYQAIIYVNNLIQGLVDSASNNYEKVSKVAGLALLVDAYLNRNSLTSSSKQSFVRRSASTTAFESGRATIISDFNLKVTEASIPMKLLYHAISYEVIEAIKNLGHSDDAESQYREMTDVAMTAFNSVIEHSCVIMVRNPSLHKYNVTAFKPIPSDKDVIGIPPLVCTSYNADRLSLFA